MISPAARRPAEDGFTLLELLVAITLLGMLMVGLLGGLRLGARAWETTDQRLDEGARLQVAQEFLRQRLAQAYPWWAPDEDRTERLRFQGEPDALQFVTLLPEHLGGGFHEFALLLDEHDVTRDLVVRWQSLEAIEDGAEADQPPLQKVLLAGIDDLELAYYGALDPAQPADWLDKWVDMEALPRLVRVAVRFPPEDGRTWPELIVRPMIDLPALGGF